eukprot:CAMPEP_0197827630 /NCGR_PEP_ID=MMETSP1437-20131217/4368_1 /TAXON_ID=49252 ORGANISM="Eucampia antarctica, Strain CCMP1452" /NCGR_SAMPLE_ID=MMETSP1437 /ASSEMBLY_ACC=CAM_ASM_001096 /LENGTH=539 /DNA_ID=CAMNT_0043428553 /DNA_START=61 /DNA_END=1676 /DNA_ORIENTATION=+
MGSCLSTCTRGSKRSKLSRCIDYSDDDDGDNDHDNSVLGDIYYSSSLTKEMSDSKSASASSILTSWTNGAESERKKQVFRCIVESKNWNEHDSNGTWVLCWVSNQGTLHHYYTNKKKVDDGAGDDDDKEALTSKDSKNIIFEHEEQTYTGDAFVLYRMKKKETKRPTKIRELYQDPENLYNIVCSYRLQHALDPCYDCHCLYVEECDDNEEGTTNKFRVRICSKSQPDDEYRVIIRPPMDNDCDYRLPPFTESWEIEYTFRCPPLPRKDEHLWDEKYQTLYIWGDLDFQQYDASTPDKKKGSKKNGKIIVDDDIRKQIHPCTMNQIVPQVMTGRCLAANDEHTFEPTWMNFDSWVIQAQYFWQTENTDPRALCGPIIPVQPGDMLRTSIRYVASTGNIFASIEVVQEQNGSSDNQQSSNKPTALRKSKKQSSTTTKDTSSFSCCSDKKSEIVISRPFLHDLSLFSSWKNFFQKCQDVEEKLTKGKAVTERIAQRFTETVQNTKIGPLARPGLCVEYKGRVNVDILKYISPFEVVDIRAP